MQAEREADKAKGAVQNAAGDAKDKARSATRYLGMGRPPNERLFGPVPDDGHAHQGERSTPDDEDPSVQKIAEAPPARS